MKNLSSDQGASGGNETVLQQLTWLRHDFKINQGNTMTQKGQQWPNLFPERRKGASGPPIPGRRSV